MKGKTYRYFLQIRINFLWVSSYLKNAQRINKICKIIDNWNKEIPSFTYKFSYLNKKSFVGNYKYWIHWIRKMDSREKLVFKGTTPWLLLNEEEWVYLDLSKNNVLVIYYYYYFPDSQWISLEIFKTIEQLQVYLAITESSSKSLVEYINMTIHSELFIAANIKRKSKKDEFPELVLEGGGISFKRK